MNSDVQAVDRMRCIIVITITKKSDNHHKLNILGCSHATKVIFANSTDNGTKPFVCKSDSHFVNFYVVPM